MQAILHPRALQSPLWRALQAELERRGIGVTVDVSKFAGHVLELARDGEAPAVLAVGGDGTIHEAINGLRGRPLLIVPVGSGNDTARSLGIPRDAAGLAALLERAPRPMDLIRVDFPDGRNLLVIGSVGVGLSSQTVRMGYSLRGRVPGGMVYFAGLVAGLVTWRNRELELVCDTRSWRGKILNCNLANLKNYGGGMIASPRADGFDGEIDCVTMALGLVGVLRNLRKTYSGDWDGIPGVEQWRAKSIEVNAPRPLPVQADGELLGVTPFRCSVVPGALNIFA